MYLNNRRPGGQSSDVHVGVKKSKAYISAEAVNEVPTVQASVDQQLRWLSSRVGKIRAV
jgi:hypothetical protein